MKDENVLQLFLFKSKNGHGSSFFNLRTTNKKVWGSVEIPNGKVPKEGTNERVVFQRELHHGIKSFIKTCIKELYANKKITGYQIYFDREITLKGNVRWNHHQSQDLFLRLEMTEDDRELIFDAMRYGIDFIN